jgi:dipeptidyl aminopeptidase/acylaminoacyl peptidase
MPDPRITAAIGHWAPRLIANGVPYVDFQEVTAGLERWEEWCGAWSARAAIHEGLGRQALDEGRGLSAGEHLSTAAVCYHFGKFLFVVDPAQMRAAHEKAVACRRLALPHLDPAGERVMIPFEGNSLAAELRLPLGVSQPPVVVMIMGLDSAKEEMASYEQSFLARGMATLAVDGPGQGEAEYDIPIRPEYEQPVAAILDWIEGRGDLDAGRIALWGVSLGGYYAPRAAAFERRVRACVALSGPYDWHAAWDRLPQLTRDVFQVRAHAKDEAAALAVGQRMSLAGIAERIICPLYIVAGKRDSVVPWEGAVRLAAEAKGPVELVVVEDGNHVVNNRPYRYRTQSADWLARQLGVKK